jgi:hypothetical protein
MNLSSTPARTCRSASKSVSNRRLAVAAIARATLLLAFIAPAAHGETLVLDFGNATPTGALHPYCDNALATSTGSTTPPGPPWRDDFGISGGGLPARADLSGLDRSSCDDWQRFCWENIATLDSNGSSRGVAMCATVVGGDYEGRFYLNGINAGRGFGRINLRSQSCVELKFQFLWQDTLATTPTLVDPAPEVFEIVVLDMDSGASGIGVDPQEAIEAVRVVGTPPFFITRTQNTEVAKLSTLTTTTPTSNTPYDPPGASAAEGYIGAQGNGPYSLLARCPDPGGAGDDDPRNDYFVATQSGVGGDNPSDLDNLTELQANRTVAFEFLNTSEFTLGLYITMADGVDSGGLEGGYGPYTVQALASDNSFNLTVPAEGGDFLLANLPPGGQSNESEGFRIGNRVSVTGFSNGANIVPDAIITDLTATKMTVACATPCALADETATATITRLADGWRDPDEQGYTYPANTISVTGPNTFTDSAGQFVNRGFTVGQRLTVTGFSANGGQNNVTMATIASVNANTMTINTANCDAQGVSCTLVNEGAGADVILDSAYFFFYDNIADQWYGGRNFLFAGRAKFADVVPCTAEAYMVSGSDSVWSTLDLVTGAEVQDPDGYLQAINAIGYNVKDRRIWGYDLGKDNGTLTRTARDRSGSSWVTAFVGPITGLPSGQNLDIGDVDEDGVLYLASRLGPKFYKVDVDPDSDTYLDYLGEVSFTDKANVAVSIEVADWAFNPKDGQLYGVSGTNEANGELFRFNPATGVVEELGAAFAAGGCSFCGSGGIVFGAVFFDADGFFYIARNQTPGEIYRLDLRTPPVTDYNEAANTVLFSNRSGGPVDQNDGAMCPQAKVHLDFGDAPGSYGTTLAENGPRHRLAGYSETANKGNLMLGSKVGSEFDGNPNVPADNDDSALGGEDGVIFSSPGGGAPRTIETEISVKNDTGVDAYLYAWMDVPNGSGVPGGTFTAGERQTTAALGAGDHTITFTWTNLPAVAGHTYFRFRVCTNPTQCESHLGPASDGEVEDYRVNFDFGPTAVRIGQVTLEGETVSAFLDAIGAGQMDDAALLRLLTAWDADLARAYAGAGREALLQALADYLDPDGDGAVAVLHWETLEQVGTVGFFVQRQQGDGAWSPINRHIMPAVLFTPLGAQYMLADPEAQPGQSYSYRLIEQEATGSTRRYGPFNVEMPR